MSMRAETLTRAVAEILKVKPCLECKASWMSLRHPIKQILPSTPYLCPYL